MKKFKDLPIEIQERMLDEQELQTGKKNPEIFNNKVNSNLQEGGFDWSKTREGFTFWNYVINDSNYYKFYAMYPKSNIQPKLEDLYPEEEFKITRENFNKACKLGKVQKEFLETLFGKKLSEVNQDDVKSEEKAVVVFKNFKPGQHNFFTYKNELYELFCNDFHNHYIIKGKIMISTSIFVYDYNQAKLAKKIKIELDDYLKKSQE